LIAGFQVIPACCLTACGSVSGQDSARGNINDRKRMRQRIDHCAEEAILLEDFRAA
jgi:hypothetical protein